MNRRRFLQNLAVTGAALESAAAEPEPPQSSEPANTEGHTLLSEFTLDGVVWKVYEDLRTRDGVITFVSPRATRVLSKTAEPVFVAPDPPYLGLNLQEIGASGPDLLADKLLEGGGDPDEQRVRIGAPPLA